MGCALEKNEGKRGLNWVGRASAVRGRIYEGFRGGRGLDVGEEGVWFEGLKWVERVRGGLK